MEPENNNLEVLLTQGSRVALAALLHDLGKFAERARIPINKEVLETNKQLYCPHRKEFTDAKGYFTHAHGAYTALAMDILEQHLPKLVGEEMTPFAAWGATGADDSLVNAAASHHKPNTFLQWVIAMADRVASGFERDTFDEYNQSAEGANHYTARQLSLLEQIDLTGRGVHSKADLKYRHLLQPMSAKSLFPVQAEGYETADSKKAQAEYRTLWDGFVAALEQIPVSHRDNMGLWLDHFETLLGVYTQAVPSATAGNTRPDVSLYDHSRATAALAVALWRYHRDNDTEDAQLNHQWEEDKFLLVQGDFFGIQNFIFASGGETNKQAAKLLRGRSFYVSLLTECAALKILESLGLPSTSQVINAAGKFLIVAPNTESARNSLQRVQAELDAWFLDKSWGQSGIGLAWQSASANDFHGHSGEKSGFRHLIKMLFEKLERAKYQRLALTKADAPVIFSDYLDSFDQDKGVCQIDGRSPARQVLDNEIYIGDLAQDHMACGNYLVKFDRVLVTRERLDHHTLELDIFGYYINFTASEDASGKFGAVAQQGKLRRAWDFSLPLDMDEVLWHGYARRNINAYVPHFDETSEAEAKLERYDTLKEVLAIGEIKTFNHLALEDRELTEKGKWVGETALMTFKGDIDDLGLMFQRGLGAPSFAKMAALSRQVNNFFAIYLPALCRLEARYRNIYTVFAGGDDFFLIGPWRSTLELARSMRRRFAEYVAQNPQVHFSASLSMTKPGLPVTWLPITRRNCWNGPKNTIRVTRIHRLKMRFVHSTKPCSGKNMMNCPNAWHGWTNSRQA